MNSRLRHLTTEYGSLAAGVAALAIAVMLAAIPSAAKNEASLSGNIPENEYNVSEMYEAEREGCALYIGGELVAVAESREELENAVSCVALGLAQKQCDTADTYSLISSVEYLNGEFPEYRFNADPISAVEASSLEVYGVVTRQITAVIDAATVYRDNADVTEGREKVLSEGSDGVIDEVYLLYYSDGKLVNSVLESSVVSVQPVNTVVERGIKLSSGKTLTSLAMFIMPYNGGISSEYGTRYLLGSSFHGGVDIAGKVAGQYCYGEPVVASGDGVVVEAGWHGDFGKLVVIEHSNGIRTYYGHMSEISVKVGQNVLQGEKIGNIGSTGKVEGPHVHFEVRIPDEKGVYYRVDPKYYIIDYSSYLRK